MSSKGVKRWVHGMEKGIGALKGLILVGDKRLYKMQI